MKRSEALLKLQRYYSIRHYMVEDNYISKDRFMDEVLQLIEELGMLPPFVELGKPPEGFVLFSNQPVVTSAKSYIKIKDDATYDEIICSLPETVTIQEIAVWEQE